MHLDIAGVMKNTGEVPYMGKGMSGKLSFGTISSHKTMRHCSFKTLIR